MIERLAWIALAAVHMLPALAFFRPTMLTRLYRLEPDNPLFLLMRHRAALFCAVFASCLLAAVNAGARPAATVVVSISMLSFLALYWQADSPKPLAKIARVDLLGLPALFYASWMAWAS